MKAFLVGLWVLVVALGATYCAAVYKPASGSATAATTETAVIQHQKTRVLNVPMVSDGAVQGFIAMQFDFTADGNALKTLQVPPEVYLLDEAFRAVYADPSLDFTNLQKYDVTRLTRLLVETTNVRLGAPVIKDVLIADFSYIPRPASTAVH